MRCDGVGPDSASPQPVMARASSLRTAISQRDWAAARSPGNGHLAGGVPGKRPPRPQWPHTPETAIAGGGGCGKPPLHGSMLIDPFVHIAPTQESMHCPCSSQ